MTDTMTDATNAGNDMDFSLTEAQNDVAELTRTIIADQLTPERHSAVEKSGVHFDRELWRSLAEAGVLSAALPESIGGGGFDLLEQCSVLTELGRGVAPVPYLASIVLGAAPIGYFGTDAQRAAWAAPAAAGDLILTAALTEDLADDPEAPVTRAERDGDGWVITGAKAVVPFGTVADAFLVPASTPDGPGLFIVTPGDAGVRIEAQRIVDGDVEASLDLAGVRVADDRRIAGHPDVVHWLVARATIGLCALQLGILEQALALTVAYARERVQFDRPIGSFQAVGQRLADAYIDVEGVRLTMWEAAWRAASALPAPQEIATAKFWACDAGHRVAHTAVHVHGGTGIDMDGQVHRYFTAAKRVEFSLGTATTHLRRLGADLAATPA